MRLAIYARVSTDDQSPAMQLTALRNYATAKGFAIVREFVDQGFSGMSRSRPEFDQMMALARSSKYRPFDAVIVWKVDRLSRSLRQLLITISELEHHGVTFMSYSENIDLSTPAGRFMLSMIGAAAEFERSMIAERIKAGIACRTQTLKQNGFFVARNGNKRTHWGRIRNVDHERVCQLHTEGLTNRQIAPLVGCSHQQVSRIIRLYAKSPVVGEVGCSHQHVARI